MPESEHIHYDVHHLLNEIQVCLVNKCYFSALSTALILPDICSKIVKQKHLYETNDKTIRESYSNWCNTWMSSYLPAISLSNYGKATWGTILYKLRCSILHNGELDVCGKNYQWFDLIKFKFYVNEKPCHEYAMRILKDTATSGCGYKNNIYIAVDICFLVKVFVNSVIAFESNFCLDEDDFPSLDITVIEEHQNT